MEWLKMQKLPLVESEHKHHFFPLADASPADDWCLPSFDYPAQLKDKKWIIGVMASH